MANNEQQAMTSERLAEIYAQAIHDNEQTLVLDSAMACSLAQARDDRDDLIAEVWRLRAAQVEITAVLVKMLRQLIRDADATYVDVRPYAGMGHAQIVGPFYGTLEQARALLASASAAAGDQTF